MIAEATWRCRANEAASRPFQKSSRRATWPTRFPEFSADCTDVTLPKPVGLETLRPGTAKFGWLRMLVKVASMRILSRSFSEKFFDRPPATATVPGPTRMPGPELPKRLAPAGVGMKALMSNQRSGVGFGKLPSAMRSGRTVTPRAFMLVLDWSSLRLVVAVRNGPVWIMVTVLSSHPPRMALPSGIILEAKLRPLPKGSSYIAESRKRWRLLPLRLPRSRRVLNRSVMILPTSLWKPVPPAAAAPLPRFLAKA